jgi:SP family general alpha glucoside:H+ symporter-like MFS transporter
MIVVGAIMSWFWMRRAGRRRIYLIGLAASMAILAVAGATPYIPMARVKEF